MDVLNFKVSKKNTYENLNLKKKKDSKSIYQ